MNEATEGLGASDGGVEGDGLLRLLAHPTIVVDPKTEDDCTPIVND
jgi:hypothetical protein